METYLDIVYIPLVFTKIVVGKPMLAYMIAGIYMVMIIVVAKIRQNKNAFSLIPLTIALCAWLLFGWIEHDAKAKGMNIRVDLLFTGPLLFLITLFSLLHCVWRFTKSKKPK